MKKTLKFCTLGGALLGGVLGLWACGDDVTKVSRDDSGMEVVESADDLADCDSASIGRTVFASDENTVYVCSDSGWFALNQKGTDGGACMVKALSDSSGYKIVCGEDSVGVLLNGEKGDTGKTGEKGDSGKSGESCSVELLGDSSGYRVICGADTVGEVLNGKSAEKCILVDNEDGTATQICGTDSVLFYKVLCGEKPFDPKEKFCFEDSLVYDLCDQKRYNPHSEFCQEAEIHALCNGESFDVTAKFCQDKKIYDLCDGESFDVTAKFCSDEKIYDMCGGKSYDPKTVFCQNSTIYNLCSGESFDVTAKFCSEEKIYDLCGGKIFNPSTQVCQESIIYDSCGTSLYDATKQFCLEKKLYDLCGGRSYDPSDENYSCQDGRWVTEFEDTRDSRKYLAIKIGTQVWMAENLNYAAKGSTCYNNDTLKCKAFGRRYTWPSAVDPDGTAGCTDSTYCNLGKPVQGACPDGWHLPSEAEWETLKAYVANTFFGGKLDSVGYALRSTSGWDDYNGKSGNGSDAVGFRALPATNLVSSTTFWASGEKAKHGLVYYTDNERYNLFEYYAYKKQNNVSVRCIMNQTSAESE